MSDPEYIEKLEELVDKKEERVDRLRTKLRITARGRLVVRSLKTQVAAARREATECRLREVCIL